MAFDFPASPVEGQYFAPSGGPLYVFNSPVWKVAGLTTTPGEWVMTERLVTASETYSKPANLAYLDVTVIAGGGAGGGAPANGAGGGACGSGGNSGAMARSFMAASEFAASESITIGAGGLAVSAAAGNSGSASSFGSLVVAAGGGGGNASTSAVQARVSGPSAALQSTAGDIRGWSKLGSASMQTPNGVVTGNMPGAGGELDLGGAGRGVQDGQGGHASANTGAGGGGVTTTSSGAARAGGNGASGCAILREIFPAWVLSAAYPPGTIRVLPPVTTSQPYVKQPGLKYLKVQLCGSGAGGGYGRSAASQTSGGAGGGGGGYAESTIAAADLAASESITIAAGGGGGNGTTPVSPSNGSTTSFGSLVSASGGVAGIMQASTAAAWTLRGSAPGSGSAGDIKLSGSFSAGALSIIAGGGNAGMGGNGGDSKLGPGGSGGWSNTDGGPGSLGGGGGGTFSSATGQSNGGAGGGGVCILTEIY